MPSHAHRNVIRYSLKTLLFALFICISPPLLCGNDVHLSKTAFTSGEKTETILSVGKRGWYSIRVNGIPPASFAVCDRMSGTLQSQTKQEGKEGRLDILLDKGEYKIRMKKQPETTGDLSVDVIEYTEKNIIPANRSFPRIEDLDSFEGELDDLEIYSFWVETVEDEQLVIDAAGRSLSSVSLWRDGYWKESLHISEHRIDPRSGKPLHHYNITARLPAGTYLLLCVGGVKAEWPDDEKTSPFYLRRGLRHLGGENFLELEVSPFGTDHYLASGSASFFQAIQEDREPLTLRVDSSTGSIHKESKHPWCSLSRYSQRDDHIVSITAKPGHRVRLLFFNNKNSVSFSREEAGKSWFISGMRSIEGKQRLDLTAFYSEYGDLNEINIVHDEVIRIAKGRQLYRQINLLEHAYAFLAVQTKGTYRIKEFGTGAKAEYRFYLSNDSESRYHAPFTKAGNQVELTNGYYVFEIRPVEAGILHFAVYHRDDEGKVKAIGGTIPQEPANQFIWPRLSVSGNERNHTIQCNEIPGVSTALIKRELPLSLDDPLPLYLNRGESVTLSISVDAESLLEVEGISFTLSIDNRKAGNAFRLEGGLHSLTLTNTLDYGDYFSLNTRPIPLKAPKRPLSVKDPETVYQVLTTEQPVYTDFSRRELKPYLLLVSQPALYRIETSGRLATKITMRTPVKTDVFSVSQNGVGRNALFQTYLKQGTYLVQVETLGQSAGRCGIHCNKTGITEGATIRDESICRYTLEGDRAIRFGVSVGEAGNYLIETIGFQSDFPYRFEEEGGWPLVLDGNGAYRGYCTPGEYTYYSLPLDYRTRRITSMRKTDPVGENEREIVLNGVKKGIWNERPGRPPDVYSLSLPAAMTITIDLSAGMKGSMIHLKTETQIAFPGAERNTFECDGGEYRIELSSNEENNAYPYTITVRTDQLAPGLSKQITRYPATIEVRNDEKGILRMWSYGKPDLKASLYNSDRSLLLDRNDDMEHDWNFEMLSQYDAGSYLLYIEKQDKGYDNTSTVFLDRIRERTPLQSRKNFPLTENLVLGENTITRIPFFSGARGGLARILCTAELTVTGTLYQGDRRCASFQNELTIPLKPDRRYDLILSHRLQKDIEATIAIEQVETKHLTLDGKKEADIDRALRLVNTMNTSFTISGVRKGLLFSPGYEVPAEPVTPVPYNMIEDTGWIFNTNDEHGTIGIEPVIINKPSTVSFPLNRTEHSFSLSYYANDILLLEAWLPGKKIGLSVAGEGERAAASYRWEGMGMDNEKTMFGLPIKGEFRGRLWIAEDSPAREDLPPCTISATSFALQNKETLPFYSEKTVTLGPGNGYTFTLTAEPQLIRLLLSKGLIAFHWENGGPRQLYAATSANQSHIVPANGGSFSIVNTTGKPLLFRIEASRAEGGRAEGGRAEGGRAEGGRAEGGRDIITCVDEKTRFRELFLDHGTLRLTVTSKKREGLLCVSGNIASAVLKAENGIIYQGEMFSDARGLITLPLYNGICEIYHKPGCVFVWQADSSEVYAPMVKNALNRVPEPLKNGMITGDGPGLFTVNVKTPGFLHIRSELPGTLALFDRKKLLSINLSRTATGNTLFRNVEPGTYGVYLESAGDGKEAGMLWYSFLVPHRITENGDEKGYFIGAGEYQAFVFSVEKEGLIGIGIRGEADGLSGILYDRQFGIIEEGPLIFHTLFPGDYYYLVFSGDKAIQYTPRLLGTRGSRQDIPHDVLKNYGAR
ncbi:MAG: hypothetical protein JW881_14270 [Spirochaetales bacterium]|nr:hypothetical protein [Spirochaetales bacterium]